MQRRNKANRLDHLGGLLDWGWKRRSNRATAGEWDDSDDDSACSCASTLWLLFEDSKGVFSLL